MVLTQVMVALDPGFSIDNAKNAIFNHMHPSASYTNGDPSYFLIIIDQRDFFAIASRKGCFGCFIPGNVIDFVGFMIVSREQQICAMIESLNALIQLRCDDDLSD